MSRDVLKMGVVIDRQTDAGLREWSRFESRSKRRQSGVLLRKLTQLRKEKPNELKALGLIE